MSYQGRKALGGCGCGCKGKSAPTALCSGMGRSMGSLGDDGPTLPDATTVKQLQAQLNRYVTDPNSPVTQGGGFAVALPVTGVLDNETAKRALTIALLRATEAQDFDMGGQVSTAFGNPVPFVTMRLPQMLQVATIYGDLHNFPPAQNPLSIIDTLSSLNPTTAALLTAGAVVAAMYFLGKGGRRR